MPDSAKQNFPSGDIKSITSEHTESRADHRNKRELYQSAQVLAFPGEEISAIRPTIYDLFTMFTLLFTIETPLAEDIKVISLDQFNI